MRKQWKKLAAKGIASVWSKDALADLQREIDADRDNARWVRMSRAVDRVRSAMVEVDCITSAAVTLADDRRQALQSAREKRFLDRRQGKLHL